MKRLIFASLIFCLTVPFVNGQDNDNPSRRFEEFRKERAFPSGSVPDFARENAIMQMERLVHEKNSPELNLAQQPEWRNIGPFSIGGRMKSVVIHPDNPDIVFAAAAAGGIWKTSDGGMNWKPVFDFENSIAFGALAMDPNNPEIIYAATGEAVNNSLAYLGSGIYKTTDGGNFWKLVGVTEAGAFSKIIVHPLNSNLVYAGATKRGRGFYRSQDAGATWERMNSYNVTDVSINPQNEDEVLIGVDGQGVFWTRDGGINWANRSNNMDAGIARVSVQFAPSNPAIAFALVETNGLGYIYKTTNTGVHWGRIFTGDESFFNGQGFYDNYIAVHPTNPNVVLAGGIDIWRTINGTTFENITNGYSNQSKMHVDQHCATFYTKNPNIIYVGNDGGIYRTDDLGSIWRAINNNLQVTQFYSLEIDDTQNNRNVGGTQDNGTQGNKNTDSWSILVGGDGFRVALDLANPSILYGCYTPGGRITPFRLNTASGSFSILQSGLNTNDGIWDPPIAVHPTIPGILLHGRAKLYASFDAGDNWTALNPGISASMGDRYTALGMSVADENVIYAGTSTGSVVVSRNFGETWKEVTDNGLVNRWVKDFACSREFPGTAYVVYSGFGTPHVFKTTDYGNSWLPISNGLPDIPTNAIELHPENENMIFIATDIGVFATFDGGNSWFPYGRKLPRVPVTDIQFNLNNIGQPTLSLRIATHGRSMWEVPVTTETISSPEITMPIGGEIFTSSTSQPVKWYGFQEPVTIDYSTDDGVTWNQVASNVSGTVMSWKIPNKETINARIRIKSQTDLSQERISNSFTVMLLQKGAVLKDGGVNFVPYGIAWDGRDGLWATSFYNDRITKLNLNTFLKEKDFQITGDSLFTDISMDKSTGTLYVHKMNSTTQGGAKIITLDTNGKVIRQFVSPSDKYATGLELVDGKLVVGDRDKKDEWDKKNFFVLDALTGAKEKTIANACQITYGPRCIAYDGNKFVYQICTDFPNGGSLSGAWIQKLDKNNLSAELDRIELETLNGTINARGIDIDTRDQNIWVTSFTGDIYKIAGFSTMVDVENEVVSLNNDMIETKIFPNPVSDFATVSFKPVQSIGNLNVKLFDMMGREVAKLYDDITELNQPDYFYVEASEFASGMYNLVFKSESGRTISRPLVIVRN
jgi:photosystem II stability/assembly factor-like uncharacterized protein